MEYIRVTFPEDRPVFVDGQQCGRTNRKFKIDEGTHTISLGEPRNYTPQWRRPLISGTTPIDPHVTFEKNA